MYPYSYQTFGKGKAGKGGANQIAQQGQQGLNFPPLGNVSSNSQQCQEGEDQEWWNWQENLDYECYPGSVMQVVRKSKTVDKDGFELAEKCIKNSISTVKEWDAMKINNNRFACMQDTCENGDIELNDNNFPTASEAAIRPMKKGKVKFMNKFKKCGSECIEPECHLGNLEIRSGKSIQNKKKKMRKKARKSCKQEEDAGEPDKDRQDNKIGEPDNDQQGNKNADVKEGSGLTLMLDFGSEEHGISDQDATTKEQTNSLTVCKVVEENRIGGKIDLSTVNKAIAMLRKLKDDTSTKMIGACSEAEKLWSQISIAIDSGACESVIDPSHVPYINLIQTVGSKTGDDFQSATGEPIPNLGALKIGMITREQTIRGMMFTGAPVAKPLGSVKRICSTGHTVIFDDEGSYIINKRTGESNALREEDGNYMLDVWVPPEGSEEHNRACFRRQEP